MYNAGVVVANSESRMIGSRSQSYDFLIYSYNHQRCSRLERFYVREKYVFLIKTRHAVSCAVNFYNAGVVTQSRRIGSWLPNKKCRLHL
jgi:hypothetical protein